MKYLLILFSLTSIFASNTKFNEALEELKIEEVDNKSPDLGTVPKCLKQFRNDYKNDGYNYALERFNAEKTVLNNRFTCSELNQDLGDKIENAWVKAERDPVIFNDALDALKYKEVDSKWPEELEYVRKCLKQFRNDYKSRNYSYARHRFNNEKTVLENSYSCRDLNEELGDKIENAWKNS